VAAGRSDPITPEVHFSRNMSEKRDIPDTIFETYGVAKVSGAVDIVIAMF
jgi:hypothetical protein